MPENAFSPPTEHTASPLRGQCQDDRGLLEIESAWGALTVLFLYQAFGVILSHAFAVFVAPLLLVVVQNDWDQLWAVVFWIGWGAVWIVMFLVPMSQFLAEARKFFASRGLKAFAELDSPWERVKVVLAPLGLAAALICLFAYPFPTPFVPGIGFTLVFLGISLLVAHVCGRHGGALTASDIEDNFEKGGSLADWFVETIGTLVFCGIVVFFGMKHPPAFPVMGMVGFGLLLMRLQSMLVRRSLLPQRTHHARRSSTERYPDAENQPAGLSDRR